MRPNYLNSFSQQPSEISSWGEFGSSWPILRLKDREMAGQVTETKNIPSPFLTSMHFFMFQSYFQKKKKKCRAILRYKFPYQLKKTTTQYRRGGGRRNGRKNGRIRGKWDEKYCVFLFFHEFQLNFDGLNAGEGNLGRRERDRESVIFHFSTSLAASPLFLSLLLLLFLYQLKRK